MSGNSSGEGDGEEGSYQRKQKEQRPGSMGATEKSARRGRGVGQVKDEVGRGLKMQGLDPKA